MPWTFHFDSVGYQSQTSGAVTNQLNQIPSEAVPSAKIATTNAHKKDAHWVVIWNTTPPPNPAYGDLSGKPWTSKDFQINTEDPGDWQNALNDVMTVLNGNSGDSTLTPTQAAYAKFSMDDAQSNTAYLRLFWQTESSD